MNPLVSFAANPGRKDRWRDEQTEREGARARRGRLHEMREERRKRNTRDLSRHRCGQAAPLAHPGHRQMTRLTAGLLAHGSSALSRLPAVRARRREHQWLCGTRPRRLQLRGQPGHRLRKLRTPHPVPSCLPRTQNLALREPSSSRTIGGERNVSIGRGGDG